MVQIFMSQDTTFQIKVNYKAELSEINSQIHALEKSMNHFVRDNHKDINKLKCACNETSACEIKKVYTIYWDEENWMYADLFCPYHALDSHLVSFETIDEQEQMFELIQKASSRCTRFWTSARKLASNNWIWRATGEKVNDDLWGPRQPRGDFGCGYIARQGFKYSLHSMDCEASMCYICERPED